MFDAPNAATWAAERLRSKSKPQHFSELFNSLFSEGVHVRHLGTSLSGLTASVLLEGLKALSVERSTPRQVVIGVPSEGDISRALGRLYAFIRQSGIMSDIEKKVALLRWHTVCLHMAVDLNRFCPSFLRGHKIDQRIIGGPKSPTFDAESWVLSARGRRGLLHAHSIYSILQILPTAHLQSIHVPIAAFTAAITYSAFILGGTSSIDLPTIDCWNSLILIDLDTSLDQVNDDLDHEVRHFLAGTLRKQDKCINLLYDTSLFSRTLKNLGQLWGVSKIMNQVLEDLSLQHI